MRRDAAAVQQDQGAVGALAAQVGRRCAVVAALRTGGDVGITCQVVGTVAVDVQAGDQLLGVDDALLFKLLAGDDFHRQRAFLGDALDATTRNFHTLDILLRCILRERRAYNAD